MVLPNDLFQIPPADTGTLQALTQSVETFHLLTSALELGIFDALVKPKDANELADELGLDPTITLKCCRALTGSRFLECREGKYNLTEISQTFLLKFSPFYQGDIITLMKNKRIKRWGNLPKALETGPIGSEENSASAFDERFIRAMAQGAMRGELQRTIAILVGHRGFTRAKRLLDLGGGHGFYSIALTHLNPYLHACVFDLPTVVETVTRKNISTYRADRVTTKPGDFTRDELGEGYDIVFASDVLYRPKETLESVLDKIHTGLNEGGLFVSKHWHINDLVKDITAVYFDLKFSIIEEAERLYSTEEFSRIVESRGFLIEAIHSPNHPSRIIIARKAKE